jgi:hypothetical protein
MVEAFPHTLSSPAAIKQRSSSLPTTYFAEPIACLAAPSSLSLFMVFGSFAL